MQSLRGYVSQEAWDADQKSSKNLQIIPRHAVRDTASY